MRVGRGMRWGSVYIMESGWLEVCRLRRLHHQNDILVYVVSVGRGTTS